MPGITPGNPRQAQARIRKQVERINDMVSDILDFHRGQAAAGAN